MKNYKRIERRFLTALVHIVSKIITADKCITVSELNALHAMEEHFGFTRALMAEASKMTLAEAVATLQELDLTIRLEMLEDLKSLASVDQFVDKREALLLFALSRCLQKHAVEQVLSTRMELHDLDFEGCILYVESEYDDDFHHQLSKPSEQLQAQLQSEGLQLMNVEAMVKHLSSVDADMVRLLLGYLAPQMTDGQIADFYDKIHTMDTSTFCERVLVDALQLDVCRATEPCLLMGIGGGDFLRIPLNDSLQEQVASVVGDFTGIVSHNEETPVSVANNDELMYDGYGKLFLSLLVKSAPRKSHIVVWPNKSEFTFPVVCRTLKLNQQEATVLTLILHYSTTGKCAGLPLSYCAETKRLESLYRTIYCRKKLIETEDVIYPDNLAPIRARIEKKMRTQLSGLENLEDFIPFNDDHHYRVKVPVEMVLVAPSLNEEPIPLEEYKW